LFVISTPVHMLGNLSIIVTSERGPLMLGFDASHMKVGFRQQIAPGESHRSVAGRRDDRAPSRVRAFAAEHSPMRRMAGHDAADG
jgi:hypothetical protein